MGVDDREGGVSSLNVRVGFLYGIFRNRNGGLVQKATLGSTMETFSTQGLGYTTWNSFYLVTCHEEIVSEKKD